MMLQQPSSGMRNSLANIIKNKIENDNDALDYLLPKGFSSDEHVMFLNKVPVPFNPIIPPRPPHISSTLSKETKMKNNHVTINTPYQSLERPKKISHIRFGMLTGKDIGKLSVLEVTNENLYENDSRNPVVNGCVDRRMGVSDKGSGLCGTCGQDIANCTGHFGHVTLVLPVYHPGFFKLTQNTLQSVCRECSRCLLHPETTEPKRDTILQTLQNPNCDAARREILRKKVLDAAKKITTCPWCSAPLGVVKKIAGATAVHLTHEIYKSRAFTGNDTKAIRMREIRRYQMRNAIANNPELKKIMERSSKKEAASSKEGASAAHCYTGPYQQETITPLDALWILSAIPDEDLPLIWSDPVYSRPESMIITSVIVPPVPIRPSVFSDRGTTEDDITVKVRDIVRANINLANALEDGVLAHVTLEKWNDLQTVISSMINSDLPGLAQSAAAKQQRSSRGLVQRLKGKQGRFRGNLSGKRVDFTGRTVISPDPNLEVTQVGVPLEMAMKLTYPEVVNRYNIEQLRQAVLNGPEIHPGANCIRKRGDSSSNAAGAAGSNAASGAGTPQGSLFAQRNDHLTFQSSVTGGTGPRNQPLPRPLPTSAGAKSGTLIMLGYIDRRIAAKNLKIGDVVERHIIDGDLVLFNRQPSLHKLSIMCHKAKVLPGRTLRFNECVCTPYNADFDGDEMNIHVPQTEEARTEALELMHVQYNLINPRNGEPLVAATQDFITGSYLMTSRGVFLTREQFCQAAFALDSRAEKIDIPPPTILKPVQLWTGKQLWSIVLKGIRPESPCVSFITKERLHKEPKFPSDIFTPDEKRTSKPQMIKEDPSFCENEGYVVFRNSELICGRIGKGTLGGGSKSSIIYVLVRDHSDRVAAQAMNRMTRMISRWISNHGFSFGIDDITPSQALTKIKITEIEKGEKECEEKIQKFKDGTLELRPGCNIEESLESEMSGILSRVRDTLGRICMDNLPYHNSPYTMASCGSKGSALNICQMVACVGQQIVNGKRMPDGFLRRSLPHFFMNSKEPKAKGFVRNSFYTGLEATEFFFHTMGGREGLVDTAVKTAETGYMQRRLMKALEDLAVRYDGTVRNSTEGIVQFMYGEDGLNPSCMESNDKLPIDFDRLLTHVQVLYPKKDVEAPEIDSRVMSSDELKKCCDEEFANIEPAVFGLWKGLIRIGEEKNNSDDSSSNKSVLSKLPLSGPEFFLSQVKKAMTSLIVKRKDLEDQLSQLSTIGQIEKDAILRNVNAITKRQFDEFVKLILRKYSKGISDPGEAVGAIGGQSLGEPGTQMTLKTFHFAGVASMNVTLGVPRIKEIINASKDISTPIITAYLADPTDKERASIIKARIERTSLGDICSFIEAVQYPQDYRINIKLDFDLMRYFHLEYITIHDVVKAIKTSSKIKSMFPAKDEKPVYTWGKLGITISISTPKTKKEDAGKKLKKKKRTFLLRKQKPKSLLSSSFLKKGKKNKRDDDDDDEWNGGEDEMDEDENDDDDDAMDEDNEDDNDPLGMRSRLGPIDPDKNLFFQAQDLLDLLSDVIVAGIPTVNRAVINEMEKKSPEDPSKYQILVEGAGLLAVLGQEGIDHRKTRTNHAMEIEKVLGIEAVRQIIIDEVNYIFKQYGIGIDSRHLKLLADVMTYRGQVLGITRFGMSKMKESFLMLASFEKTADHLFDAAVHGREDEIRGISECIIMGAPLPIGTGAFKLVGEVSKDTRENGIWWQDTLFDEEVASLLSELSISQNGGSSNPFIEERLTN